MPFRALPPPFDVDPHRVDPFHNMRVWFTEPIGLVSQLADGTYYDADLARWLIDGPAAHMKEISEQENSPCRIVHDWRGVTSHDSDTRGLLVKWGLTFGRQEIVRIDAVVGENFPTILLMAVQAGRLAIVLAGYKMDIVTDIDAALAGLTPRAR